MESHTTPDGISVVIPTKNAEHTLGRCLESVQNQSQPPLEIIVVDNFSADDTVHVAERYGARVYVQGFERSAQRNYGVALATGDYVLLIDADMYLSFEAVAESARVLRENDAAVLSEESFGDGFWARCKWLERRCYEGEAAIEAARGFRREVLLELGGYDEELFAFEDWDLHNRCLAAGFKVGRAASGSALIRHNEGRLSLWRSAEKKGGYALALQRYKAKHPHVAKRQVTVLPRLNLFLRHWPLLARHPLLAAGVIVMKAVEAATGYATLTRTALFAAAVQDRQRKRLRDG